MAVRFRKGKDANHDELVSYAVRVGFTVLETHNLNDGLDLLVGLCGLDQRIEIKDGAKVPSKRRLSAGEAQVFTVWRGRLPVVWESIDDVNKLRQVLLDEAVAHRLDAEVREES